jgi:hypothetical protein
MNPRAAQVRTGKDCGIGHFPSFDFGINAAWLTAAMTGQILLKIAGSGVPVSACSSSALAMSSRIANGSVQCSSTFSILRLKVRSGL